jgi:hypothetical protein
MLPKPAEIGNTHLDLVDIMPQALKIATDRLGWNSTPAEPEHGHTT